MSGFQSRVRDVINQAAPTFSSPTVADRGLLHFLDPSMTGVTRFMQKAGYPFPLLTPQMSATLTVAAAAGTQTVLVQGVRLLDWLVPGMGVAFELLEDAVVDSIQPQANGTDVLIVLRSNLTSSHDAGTRFTIRNFPIASTTTTVAGDGSPSRPTISVATPFILVPGDVIRVDGTTYTLSIADQISSSPAGYVYEVKTNDDDGLPALFPSTAITVRARAAYQSEIITVPQAQARSLTTGPAVVDWVSGPMVAEYFPDPESEVYIEEYDNSNRLIVEPRKIEKNSTMLRFRIMRDQLLFWKYAEGGCNWNGTFVELRAFDSGRVHAWTGCRPPLDAAPPSTVTAVVPAFAPHLVLLLSRIVPDTVVVKDQLTKAVIPETDYTVDYDAGTISFLASYANQGVSVTYRPRLEWQVSAVADVDDVEIVVKIGQEEKQVYTLATAGVSQILTIRANGDTPIDSIHVTARKADDSGGAYIVQMGDWQPRGGVTSAMKYTLTTAADVDYDWASSGLLLKPMWPTIELLRARLDGESIFSRYLDNGRMLV
jgi:hypothetical protein